MDHMNLQTVGVWEITRLEEIMMTMETTEVAVEGLFHNMVEMLMEEEVSVDMEVKEEDELALEMNCLVKDLLIGRKLGRVMAGVPSLSSSDST